MNKQVSVIIPTLNEERYIGKCLSSIEKQDYDGNFETIVVDGHSKDKTKEIAREYCVKLLDSPRRNIGFQRNLGTKKSKGEICFYLDADSIAPENWMSRLLEEYEKDKQTIMAGTTYSSNIGICSAFYRSYGLARKIFNKLSIPLIPGSSTSISKSVFYKVGGFSEGLYEDADLGLKARKFGKVKLINDVSVLTSGRYWERKHAKFRFFVCNPAYAISQGKINLREITNCK